MNNLKIRLRAKGSHPAVWGVVHEGQEIKRLNHMPQTVQAASLFKWSENTNTNSQKGEI